MTKSGQAGRPGAKRRTHIGEQFAPRIISMLESPAYRALSLSGHRVLARLEIELAHHGGSDNGRLPCAYEHFVEYGIDRQAIAPAIRELAALGFIEVTEQGCAGNAEHRAPNKFRLTYRHTERESPTDEWRSIKSSEAAHTLAATARKLPPTRSWRPTKKTNFSGGKPHTSVGVCHTENGMVPVGFFPPYQPSRGFPPYLYISGSTAKRATSLRRSKRWRHQHLEGAARSRGPCV